MESGEQCHDLPMTDPRAQSRSRPWLAWLAGTLVAFGVATTVSAYPFLLAFARDLPGIRAEPAGAAPGPIPVNCSNEVGEPVVKFREAVSSDATATVHRQIGAEVVGNVQGTHLQWVRALGYSDEALIRAYQNRPEIEWVRPAPNRLKESSH